MSRRRVQTDIAYSSNDSGRAVGNGRRLGVDSTPSWLLAGRLVRGLLPREESEKLTQSLPIRRE
jgi:hypothetical protein